ncbi:MAG: VPLPA-CTERM sorting domain-containing protein [Methylophilus sp.]
MKNILVAIGFSFTAFSSQAALVFNSGGLTTPTNQYNDILNKGAGATFEYGFLSANAGDVISFNNMISNVEAGYNNNFYINDTQVFSNKADNNAVFNYTVLNSGVLNFEFRSQDGFIDSNGSQNIAVLSNYDGNNGQFLLLLDDSYAAHMDFDDHAVGLSTIGAVPVPSALPLMASALGIFGIARRRNKAKHN